MADKIRVHELAKEVGKDSKEVIELLEKSGVKGKKAMSALEEDEAAKVRAVGGKAKTVKKAKKKDEKSAAKTKKKTAVKKKSASAKKAVKKKTVEKKETSSKKKVTPKKAAKVKKADGKKKEKKVTPEEEAVVRTVPKEERKQEKKLRIPAPIKEPVVMEDVGDDTEVELPDRFKKEVDADSADKAKVKPSMKRAFETIRKIEPRKWFDQKTTRKHGKQRPAVKVEKKIVAPTVTAPRKKSIKIQEGMTVKEFAELLGQKLPEIIKRFMELGIMATINQPVDIDAAVLVADALDIKVEVAAADEDIDVIEDTSKEENMVPRSPVVTIMGHVDHGKTSLLDAIRETKVTESEAGGITQHIGAYEVNIKGKKIAFLDTPGHEAFTMMRARGAKVTDIVVLVVAADDGVMPQTVEAIDHSKAAEVPIVVAINKIDKPEANVQRIKTELAEHGIVPEEWGGTNIMVEVSAKQRIGIEDVLEMILLQAEMLELKADPKASGIGTIIESRLDKGRGAVATILVQSGTIRVGDAFVAGTSFGKVRALNDDIGKRVKEAGPSVPVEVVGFAEVPQAGDMLSVVGDEKKARQIAMARHQKERLTQIARARKVKLDQVYDQIKDGEIRELNLIIKADVQGSAEAIKDSFEGIIHPEVKVRVIHTAVGGINESDVMLATASNAIIIGFNVRPEVKAAKVAESEGVDIKLYNVIYEAIDDVKKALEGLLEPTLKENILGRAEVRDLFTISRLGTIAGCYVIDGVIKRNSDGIRVIRDNIVVYDGKIASLKRFKEDTGEVQSGYECGILVENFNDIKTGDILENYIIEKIATKLEQ
ncbi:MAG: translation initiation factor IF-2 [Nitrospirota bacterium]|nr:MAG: translation initiation factor IF-2 [Nitrospirota bacterium]